MRALRTCEMREQAGLWWWLLPDFVGPVFRIYVYPAMHIHAFNACWALEDFGGTHFNRRWSANPIVQTLFKSEKEWPKRLPNTVYTCKESIHHINKHADSIKIWQKGGMVPAASDWHKPSQALLLQVLVIKDLIGCHLGRGRRSTPYLQCLLRQTAD